MAFRTNKMPILQERSASGAVASFDTALAMPLPSCNIAVNAWQEGSGDPSPVNNRPIHGFSEVNATRCGKNLFDEQYPNLGATQYRWIYVGKGTFTMSSNQPIDTSNLVFFFAGKVSSGASSGNNVKGNIYRTVTTTDGYVTIAYRKISGEPSPVNYRYQIELGSTVTSYEPYVTPTIYTIQLGQEVYGAEVDVNGVAHVTHKLDTFDLTDAISSTILSTHTRWQFMLSEKFSDVGTQLCNIAKYKANYSESSTHFYCMGTDYQRVCVFLSNEITTYSGIQVCYPLAEPFDIQLTPTQIETLIGNNTIFADTGDVDLTYKDLDLAKRGNFREVFKLPS